MSQEDIALWAQFCAEAWKEVSDDTISGIRERVLSDTPEGFEWYYRISRNLVPPPFFKKWANDLYSSDGYWINEAYRGSSKTTAITETFLSYQIGLRPERSNGLAQASPDTVQVHASNIADIIEHNPAFQLFFPDVVPDKDKGWGRKAYWVKRSDVPYGEWSRMRDKEPTLYFGSYRDAIHIGKHPTGVFIFDDINDAKNTRSDRRNAEVNEWLTDTMIPVLDKTKFRIINQTPWTTRDALALAKNMGIWKHTRTPIFIPREGGVEIVVEKNDQILMDTEADLAWPGRHGVRDIQRIYKAQTTGGPIGFARMYMLDLKAAEGVNLKESWLHEYPEEEINNTWPVVIGVDYASTADKLKDKDRDYFALAVGRIIPGGGVILVDGVRQRVSQGEALGLTRSWAAKYPTTQMVAVEAIGKGEEFYYLLLRNSRVPLIPAHTGNRSKGERFEKQMAPLFQMTRVWVTDEKGPFISAFKQEWLSWPNGEHDDCLDAVYYMTLAATQIGGLAQPEEDFTGRSMSSWSIPQERTPNPWTFR